jgi:hypothetical protein
MIPMYLALALSNYDLLAYHLTMVTNADYLTVHSLIYSTSSYAQSGVQYSIPLES